MHLPHEPTEDDFPSAQTDQSSAKQTQLRVKMTKQEYFIFLSSHNYNKLTPNILLIYTENGTNDWRWKEVTFQ